MRCGRGVYKNNDHYGRNVYLNAPAVRQWGRRSIIETGIMERTGRSQHGGDWRSGRREIKKLMQSRNCIASTLCSTPFDFLSNRMEVDDLDTGEWLGYASWACHITTTIVYICGSQLVIITSIQLNPPSQYSIMANLINITYLIIQKTCFNQLNRLSLVLSIYSLVSCSSGYYNIQRRNKTLWNYEDRPLQAILVTSRNFCRLLTRAWRVL